MIFYTTSAILFGTLLITIVPDTAAYSKYGRTCKDIGCRSDESCVMAEDPCTGYSDNCGRYPTCKRTSDVSCVSMICGSNEYCKNENGVPKCVRKSTGLGYESAGVTYVNGERVVSENNANPYANANAPPAPVNRAGSSGEYHQSSSGSSMYPPYPSNVGSSNANGYPPYPQSTGSNQAGRNQDLGYPPYPTHNRMPVPGQSSYPGYPQPAGYPQNHANYPQQYPGYQSNNPYPQNYPGQNYPNQNQRGHTYSSNSIYRRGNVASAGIVASMIIVGFSELFIFIMTRL